MTLMHGINYYNHGLLYVIDSHVRKYAMYEQCGEYIIHLYELLGRFSFLFRSERKSEYSNLYIKFSVHDAFLE